MADRGKPRHARDAGSATRVSVDQHLPMADFDDSMWQRKGATLSDKSARKEYGLTQSEIIEAIRDGRLQCRENSIHGNPFLRLLRHEVELLVERQRGVGYLRGQRAKAELAEIEREIKKLKKHVAALEERKSTVLAELEKPRRPG